MVINSFANRRGHVMRSNEGYIGTTVRNSTSFGARETSRPKRRL